VFIVYPPSTLKGEEDKAYKQIYFFKNNFFSKCRGAYVGERVDHFILRPPVQFERLGLSPTNQVL
jgi:hypothetical protein